MPQASPGITLMGFLGGKLLSERQLIRTRLFGGPYLRFADYVNVSAYLYQCGALLGRTKQDKLIILARMLAQPGREGDYIEFLQHEARERLREYTDTYGQQPTVFPLFLMATEYKKAGIVLPFGGAPEPPLAHRAFTKHMKQMTKMAEQKMPLEEIEPLIKLWGQEGIGFGSYFPELTEKMYREANENINLDKWAEARKYGLDLPEAPTIISLEEQEEIVLSMVAIYTGTYFPEMVEPLGLTEILRQAGNSPEELHQI